MGVIVVMEVSNGIYEWWSCMMMIDKEKKFINYKLFNLW